MCDMVKNPPIKPMEKNENEKENTTYLFESFHYSENPYGLATVAKGLFKPVDINESHRVDRREDPWDESWYTVISHEIELIDSCGTEILIIHRTNTGYDKSSVEITISVKDKSMVEYYRTLMRHFKANA